MSLVAVFRRKVKVPYFFGSPMASASVLFAATGLGSMVRVKSTRLFVKSSLDTNVSDMSVNAPKGLFPPEPEHYRGPKLKVAIIGAGLAGMSTAVELLDQGHEVDIFESRPFIGGKVGSFVDRKGNHIEMGLHVFFGCYNNLFRLMKKVGADQNLLVKDHTHTFVNKGGELGGMVYISPYLNKFWDNYFYVRISLQIGLKTYSFSHAFPRSVS